MADREDVEKVRQEIMRFHELLDIMREKLQDGERAYAQLFSSCSPEDVQRMKPKDLQWKLAEQIVADLSPLSKAVMRARFDARNLERDFEELYDIIVSTPEP
ncbi:MAG: hypothetical protein ACYDBJ_16010 [Aggregatilineales bacterium]